jgi:putative peptidoglycan lipid II flippase
MVSQIFSKGKKIFTNPQNSIVSAASIIMIMIIASRILGLIRQRTLALYFTPDDLSLFFAAFRLPDLIFEVLVFGTFSSAFIPVFTKALHDKHKNAWDIAGRVVNIGLVIFLGSAIVFAIFAGRIYTYITPGFSPENVAQIASLARILFAAQAFFVVSYVLTGVLESSRRFLVPALAPIFYNLGIILGTILFNESLGLMAPTIGVVMGAFAHLLVQLPLALKLGFRPVATLAPTPEVKEIGRLSVPRLVDLSVEQIQKTAELFLASLISQGAYTYFTLATSLQILPVNLFGTSLAKAALPTLSRQEGSPYQFKKTLFTALNQIIFLIAPAATVLIVLRIPIVRLVFGTSIFDWEATVQTGLVLSAFAFGISFQAVTALLERGFYALHDTKTPVAISITTISLMVIGDFILVRGLGLPVWALAASFSGAVILQSLALFYFLGRRLGGDSVARSLSPAVKAIVASLSSGLVMFFILKIFDRSVWVKKISFLGQLGFVSGIPFERFVLDTRYTANLLVLTFSVAAIGALVYLVISILLKSEEVWFFANLIKRTIASRMMPMIPAKETEPITPPADNSEV